MICGILMLFISVHNTSYTYLTLTILLVNERRVPLIYFIGKNGTSLDAITGVDDLGALSNRIEGVLKKAGYATVSSSTYVCLHILTFTVYFNLYSQKNHKIYCIQ